MGRAGRSASYSKGFGGSMSGSGSGSVRRPPPSFWAGVGVSAEVMVAGLALTVLYQYLSTHRQQVMAALGGGSRARRYSEFAPFYSQLYRKEHDAPWNRYMHFAGTTLAVLQLIRDPRLLIAGLVSVVFGLNLFELTYMLPHGMLEFVLMGVVFMALGKHMTGSYRKPWGVLFIGYFFAWFGHFVVERNRPATFTYAVYSLIGDFQMWWDTARELWQLFAAGPGVAALA